MLEPFDLSQSGANRTLARVDLQDYLEIAREDRTLRFLVIGGYAVAAHGHSRATFDVDFLAASEDRGDWMKKLLDRGFKLVSEMPAFAQFSPPDQSTGLDLMFVAKETFDQFWADSEERAFGKSVARVPSLDHLLALKLHVLKQRLGHRTFKDAEDVEMLARRNELNLDEKRYEKLFLKYGTREPSDASFDIPELELPVDREFHALPPKVSLQEYCRLNQEFRKMFPKGIPSEQERLARKVSEVFVF